jgi:hypothetical protein
MRYDAAAPSPTAQEPVLARAKNTSRAEARRRSRDAERAMLAQSEADEQAIEDEQPAAAPAPRPMFRIPDIRSDVRSLPSMFRTRRLLWIPYIMIVVGFVLTLVGPGLSPELFNLAVAYIQLFFLPQSLLAFFFAGFLAPRASYLAGFLAGLLTGVLWALVIYVGASTGLGLAGIENFDPFNQASASFVTSVVFGTLAGWFAGWYRDFLRQMQERGRARRADKEAQDRARRRTERQETRRAAKKPTG